MVRGGCLTRLSLFAKVGDHARAQATVRLENALQNPGRARQGGNAQFSSFTVPSSSPESRGEAATQDSLALSTCRARPLCPWRPGQPPCQLRPIQCFPPPSLPVCGLRAWETEEAGFARAGRAWPGPSGVRGAGHRHWVAGSSFRVQVVGWLLAGGRAGSLAGQVQQGAGWRPRECLNILLSGAPPGKRRP